MTQLTTLKTQKVVDSQMQIQILKQISQVSDNLDAPVLGNAIAVSSDVDHDFTETDDIEGELSSIFETNDNLKRSLDYGV